MDHNPGGPSTPHPPHPEQPPPPPPAPAPAGSASSSQRKSSSHIRPIIVLKRRSNPDPTDHSEKTVETAKSYAEMATKAIKPAEDADTPLNPAHYNKLFPSLSAEVAEKVTSSEETEPTKLPISTQKMEGRSEDLPPATFNIPNKEQKPKASFPHRRNVSHGSSREFRNQYIPQATIRSVSFNSIEKPHFGLTQGPVEQEISSSSAPKPKRQNSGYYNPTRTHIEGYSTKLGENKEGHPFHNLSTHPANPEGYKGSTRRHSSHIGRGRGRGRSPTSPGGTPLRGINWRHERGGKKKGTKERGGDRTSTGELGSLAKGSSASPFGGKNPTRVTTKASDITRPVLERWTDETSLSSGRGLEEEEDLGSHTLPPKGSLEHGYQDEGEPQIQGPKPSTVSVAKVHVPPFSSGSPSASSRADDNSTSKPHDTRNDLQQPGLQLSVPQPQPQPPSSPALDTPTPAVRFGNSDYLSPPPPRFQLPPIPSCFQKHLGSANQQTEQTPLPKLSADEYSGLQGEYTMPQQTTERLSPTSARIERNTVFDNKNTINSVDKMADLDEGYEAIGPSKVVQYAPMVQDKASKAFAGHEKVNFGDIDSKRAGLAPGQAVSGNPAFKPPAGFTDQRTSFVTQSREDRLPPRPAQPPPGLPLPPGLPIPPSYYQQKGITPQTGLGNSSFSQPSGRAAPFARTTGNRQAAPGQHRRLYPDMGPFTVGQRSDANDSYLGLSATDAEIKAINETFTKYGRTNEEETPSLTDRYGRRGADSEQGSSSKDGQPGNGSSNRKTTEKDNFKERFEEVFGTKGKVSIEMLQEHQKKRLVAERVRNEKLAAENEKKVSEPVIGNTGLFPYPAHGKSDSEVTRELLVEAFKQLSSYVEDKSTIKGVGGKEKEKSSAYKAGPWKKTPAGKTQDWISDDNTSFFNQSFGKDYVSEGKLTAGGGGPSSKPAIGAAKLKQTAAEGGASNTGGSRNQSARKDLTVKDGQSVDQGQASNAPNTITFGPAKPPLYPDHIPPRQHLRPLKAFAPFENDQPKARYGLLPANPRSTNTVEQPYINYRGGAVGPVADSAPRYVRGPKGFLELATDMPPHPPVNPSPFKQPKNTPSPFAALEQALGTTRFTQGVPERYRLAAPKPPPGAKPTGGLITDTINCFLRPNYGGRQTQLDPDARGLPRSEVLKQKQRPGARFGVNFNGPNGMEFDIDKIDFNPAEQNALGTKFKLNSQPRREQEAMRDQQSQQPHHPQARGVQQVTPVKGIPVQGKGSAAGSGTRSISDMPPSGNPQPGRHRQPRA